MSELKGIVAEYLRNHLQEEINKQKVISKHAADVSKITSDYNANRLGVKGVEEFTGGSKITAEETIWPTATSISVEQPAERPPQDSFAKKAAPYIVGLLAGLGGLGGGIAYNMTREPEPEIQEQFEEIIPPAPDIGLEVD